MVSRTEHTIKNIFFAVIVQIINIIIKFVVRTIFIKTLGQEYLGIGGVFSNILTVLSLAELGIGTVIVYDMYKPISENNENKVTQLFNYYKKVYAYIGIFIAVFGSLLLPFLGKIITDVPNVQHIKFIYILHLADSVSSYFYAHCRSLFNAYQLNRVNSKNNLLISILKTILEIIALIATKSYIVYMVVQIVVTIFGGYLISLKAKKMFPFIKNSVSELDNESKRGIFKNAAHMLNIRVGSTLINATDNLIISAFISTILVGIYSNYSMIVQIILSTTFLIESSLTASVGNLCATSSSEKKCEVFMKLQYLYSCIFGIVMIGLYGLFNAFINLWIGEEYLLSPFTVFIITLNCYLSGIHQPVEAYINSDGLFKYFKIKPFVEVGINFLVSIIGAKLCGINGVLIGTTLSHVMTTLWFDPLVLYKYSFMKKANEYFIKYFKSLGLAVGITLMMYVMQKNLIMGTILEFGIRIVACLCAVVIFLLLNTGKSDKAWIKQYIKLEKIR